MICSAICHGACLIDGCSLVSAMGFRLTSLHFHCALFGGAFFSFFFWGNPSKVPHSPVPSSGLFKCNPCPLGGPLCSGFPIGIIKNKEWPSLHFEQPSIAQVFSSPPHTWISFNPPNTRNPSRFSFKHTTGAVAAPFLLQPRPRAFRSGADSTKARKDIRVRSVSRSAGLV